MSCDPNYMTLGKRQNHGDSKKKKTGVVGSWGRGGRKGRTRTVGAVKPLTLHDTGVTGVSHVCSDPQCATQTRRCAPWNSGACRGKSVVGVTVSGEWGVYETFLYLLLNTVINLTWLKCTQYTLRN